jgi:putative transposase
MRKSKFTEQQIAFILKQADDGVSVEDTCRKAGTSAERCEA